jgi:Mitochondrial ribosomal protein (VAR1)
MVFNKKKSYLLNKLMKIKMKIYQMKNNKNYNENIIKNKIIQFNEHNISEFNSNLSINFFETKILESINLINLKKFSIIRLKKQKKFNTKFRYYLALLYLNSYKFNNLNLINLKKIIHKVYNKNIKLNIINIKYSYLDSTIFTQTIMKKLNDRKKNILGVLKKTFKLVKLAKLNDNLIKNNLNTIKYKINNLTKHREFIDKYFINKKELILNKIKYLHIIGLFMEAKGRLTKRMTASRSV